MKTKKDARLEIRLTAKELKSFQAAAEKRGRAVSDWARIWLRWAAMQVDANDAVPVELAGYPSSWRKKP